MTELKRSHFLAEGAAARGPASSSYYVVVLVCSLALDRLLTRLTHYPLSLALVIGAENGLGGDGQPGSARS
jgi:hypothetical protein